MTQRAVSGSGLHRRRYATSSLPEEAQTAVFQLVQIAAGLELNPEASGSEKRKERCIHIVVVTPTSLLLYLSCMLYGVLFSLLNRQNGTTEEHSLRR